MSGDNDYSFRKLNNGGFTLVELVVSFALLGLLFVAGAGIITSSMKVYFQIKGTDRADQVSQIIVEKATGIIESSDPETIELMDDGKAIRLVDIDGNQVVIHQVGGYFAVDYGESNTDFSWQLDRKLYNGFVLDGLSFMKASDEYSDDVYQMIFSLKSEQYGDFNFVRYIECYR